MGHPVSETSEPTLVTPGVISRETGIPLRRVLYILQTRQDIRPRARVGILRVYDNAAVEEVRRESAAIDKRKNRGAQ